MSQYPEDEFDVAGRERAPQGTHRAPRNPWRALLPYALVIVLVPLLAWGAVGLLGGSGSGNGDGGDGGDAQETETTAPPTAEETTEPADEEPTDSEEATEVEESESPDEGLPADVITTTSISVLNGAGITGIAAEAAAQLTDAGFTAVVAADYGASAPEATTLYYRNADLAPTAEAIGDLLGIGTLVELASATQNVEIAIVLRADFA